MVLGWPGWYHSSRWREVFVGGGDLNCNRPICGGGRLLFLLGVPISLDFWSLGFR
jgi:hypothetical protein